MSSENKLTDMSFSSKYLVKSLSACSVDLRVFVASFFLTISLISKLVISANLLLFAPELSEHEITIANQIAFNK
jgi:hypothetical protein